MKRYKLIIFDLDGTLADTSAGIIACHRYANAQMGSPIMDDRILDGIIGGPLLKTYIERFGYSPCQAKQAVGIYRDYYKKIGFSGCELYPGMDQCLRRLKADGYLLAVATLKEEKLAKQIFRKLGVEDHFDLIHGMDAQDTLSKSDLLEMCMDELHVQRSETILIGDSIHDANGAKEAKVGFLAVTYGFGFAKGTDCSQIAAVTIAEDCTQLMNYFAQ